MNEEKRPTFPDKYHLSRKESVYLLKKNIVELVYNAGKFEGLNTTLLQTEEIIKYNRANNVAVDDVLTVVNLKRGFEMLLNDIQEPLIETSKRINRIVAAEDALFPGEIRNGGVEVSTIQGRYVPPMLTEDEVNNQYGEIMNQEISETVDLSQYLGHILVETVTSFLLLPTLQTPVGLDSESSYGFDFGYKTLQCS
ncbi:TPA: hypothetical protein ACOWQC_002626 [Enterococcus faecium]|mgnify:CR=1 FL=1